MSNIVYPNNGRRQNRTKITIKVIKEKRTVVAIAQVEPDCLFTLCGKYGIYPYSVFNANNQKIVDGLFMPKKIVAVAKCHPDDEFDEAKGIKIARAKLQAKLINMRTKRLGAFYQRLFDLVSNMARITTNKGITRFLFDDENECECCGCHDLDNECSCHDKDIDAYLI